MTHDGKTEDLPKLLRCLPEVLAHATHQDDAGLALLLAEKPEQFNAIHLRHQEVEQDESRFGRKRLQEGLCIGRRGAIESHDLRGCRDELTNIFVIVDYQDLLARLHSSSAFCRPIRSPPPAGWKEPSSRLCGIVAFHDAVNDCGELGAL